MTARKLLASAAMSATLLLSLTQVAAADERPTQRARPTAAARRARAARPVVRRVIGNGKAPAYMAPQTRRGSGA